MPRSRSRAGGSKARLPNLLRWPGGKSRLRKRILAIIPEHCTYVEPFAGGASIFFAKEPAKKEVLNDVSVPLMQFFRGTAKGGLRKCSYRHSRATFDKLMKKYKSGKKLTACEYFILNKISFGGEMRSFAEDPAAVREGKNPKAGKVFARLPEFEARLRHAKLERGDFAKIMKKHDSPCAVHFIDPPYEKAVSRQTLKKMYPQGTADPARVRDVAKRMKGKVIITYGDHPDIRKLFCTSGSGFHCTPVVSGYSQSGGASNGGTKWKDGHQLIITNFSTKKKRRG